MVLGFGLRILNVEPLNIVFDTTFGKFRARRKGI